MTSTENQRKFKELTHLREALGYIERFKDDVFVIAIDIDCFIKCDQLTLIQDIMILQTCGIHILIVIGSLKHPKNKREEEVLREKIDEAKGRIADLAYAIDNTTINLLFLPDPLGYLKSPTSKMSRSQWSERQHNHSSFTLISCKNYEDNILISLTQAVESVIKSIVIQKLIFLSEYTGIYGTNKTLLQQAHPNEITELIKDGCITGTLIEISEIAIKAVNDGIPRAHIIKPSNLLSEIFDKDGIGTMIYRGYYQEIRRANKNDISGIIDLLSHYTEIGLVRQINLSGIQKKLQDFFVATRDGRIIGCGCIENFSQENKGFISSIAVNPDYISQGIGSKIVATITENARKSGIEQLSLVSPKSSSWWLNQEFGPGNLEDLPEKIKTIYKNSLPTVLIKRL